MANCQYCGLPAGFLRKQHKECFQQYIDGKNRIVNLIENCTQVELVEKIQNQVSKIARDHFINQTEITDLIVHGWEYQVEKAFEDGILSEDEEDQLVKLQEIFELTQDKLDENGSFTKIAKGATLRDVLEGQIKTRMTVVDQPFNLQNNETLIWLFTETKLFEQKTRTHYVGGSRGISVRIAKGVYYRASAFRGERIQTDETVLADTGFLGITDKHVYFLGFNRGFKINHKKVLSFKPYEDGIGIQKDGVRAKPQIFETGDGWFTYNLITNLAQM